ncbi:tyrosine-protein phosphatase [Lactiplantibacillus plantarum]
MGLRPTEYIDLHCHLLPGLDDGPQQLAQAVEMARQAVADGIHYVLATPHHLDRRYQNTGLVVERAVAELQAELKRQQIPLTVFAGQEVHLRDDLATALLTAGSLVGQFGRAVKSTALELVECGLVQVIASDAHLMARRGFMMRAGYQALARLDSTNPASFAVNARLLLNGDPVVLGEVLRPNQRRKFWLF